MLYRIITRSRSDYVSDNSPNGRRTGYGLQIIPCKETYEACPGSKYSSRVGRYGSFYAYCGNTAVDLDPLPASRAHLTVVEPALFEWDVFELAALIQSLAKCEVPSVIRFLKAKREVGYIGPSAVHSGPRAQRFPFVSSSKETYRWEKVRRQWWGARRSHDVVQRAGDRLLWFGDTEAGSKT
jgi:hypothetical protein